MSACLGRGVVLFRQQSQGLEGVAGGLLGWLPNRWVVWIGWRWWAVWAFQAGFPHGAETKRFGVCSQMIRQRIIWRGACGLALVGLQPFSARCGKAKLFGFLAGSASHREADCRRRQFFRAVRNLTHRVAPVMLALSRIYEPNRSGFCRRRHFLGGGHLAVHYCSSDSTPAHPGRIWSSFSINCG
jgi:hypothetical protein